MRPFGVQGRGGARGTSGGAEEAVALLKKMNKKRAKSAKPSASVAAVEPAVTGRTEPTGWASPAFVSLRSRVLPALDPLDPDSIRKERPLAVPRKHVEHAPEQGSRTGLRVADRGRGQFLDMETPGSEAFLYVET
jgi:hypothetical protein